MERRRGVSYIDKFAGQIYEDRKVSSGTKTTMGKVELL
jgi:hypothetical protein